LTHSYFNPSTLWGGRKLTRAVPSDDAIYRWYIDQKSQLQREKLITVLPNPFGAPAEHFMSIGEFELSRCTETGFIFANPRLTTEGSRRFFTETLGAYFDEVEATVDRRRELSYLPLANQLKKLLPSGCRLLEVGCGSGAQLEVLREVGGFKVEGVEISPAAQKYHASRRLTVHSCAIEEMTDKERYEAVVLWSVADHFADPSAALSACYRLLRGGGYLFIGNINTDGFDISTIGTDSLVFAPPGRVNFYNAKALRRQLTTLGFQIVAAETPGRLDIAIVREYWRSGGRNGRNAFLEALLLDDENHAGAEAFQEYLRAHNLSGFQTVLAQKPA
jgi:2-polyprenyl-3-methyl-5-hydroxy-6-metoxy-1,4-benzoquinol methylase